MPENNTGQTQETPQYTPEQALLENMRLMEQIAREMREVPELPSEKPHDDDIHHLTRVEFPPAGGVLTFMDGYDHPFKGYPIGDLVERIDLVKKVMRNLLSATYHKAKKHKVRFLFSLLFSFQAAYILLYTAYRIIDRFKIKRERYCDAVRELHRAFSKEFYGESEDMRATRFMARDVICMVLEFDNAYRFRFQDIFSELDTEAVKKHPSKELRRLLTLMQSRERTQEIRDTWTLLKYFLPLLLLKRSIKRNVIGVLAELDTEKVRLAEEDKVFCEARKDYKFGYKQYVD